MRLNKWWVNLAALSFSSSLLLTKINAESFCVSMKPSRFSSNAASFLRLRSNRSSKNNAFLQQHLIKQNTATALRTKCNKSRVRDSGNPFLFSFICPYDYSMTPSKTFYHTSVCFSSPNGRAKLTKDRTLDTKKVGFSGEDDECCNDYEKSKEIHTSKGSAYNDFGFQEDEMNSIQKSELKQSNESISSGQSFFKPLKEWGLKEFTMFASFLCAVDCTVFPILLTALPAAEFLSPANVESIHEISHQAALYIVLPIGSATTITNYIMNKNKQWAAVSVGALSLIFASNIPQHGVLYELLIESGDQILDAFKVSTKMTSIFHEMHESRIYNTAGCLMLMCSSYFSHKISHKDGKCSHHHHH